MPYLLDTNTCIHLMRNVPKVIAHLASRSPGECFVSTVTTYELFTGVAKCAIPSREKGKVELLLSTLSELPLDHRAAVLAGQLRADLERVGRRIGPYDILLAAQAVSNNLTLVTGNQQEFQRIPSLHLDDWNRPTA